MNKPKSHTRRNLFLVVLFFVLAALAVVGSRFFPRDTIPPESPEITAKRADRENNGWYLLEKLLADMPDKPQPLWGPLPDEGGMVGNYKALPGSLGNRTRVDRPDDDPLFQEYLTAAEKLTPRIREVLDKPYILLPPEACDPASGKFIHPASNYSFVFVNSRSFFPLMCTHAFILSGRPEGSAKSADLIKDLLELTDRMHEASAIEYVLVSDAFEVLPRIQPEQQRGLLDWMVQTQSRRRPSREKIEFDIRQHKAFLDSLKKHGSIGRPLEAAKYLYIRTMFMRHFGRAFEVACLTSREYEQLVEQDAVVRQLEYNPFGYRIGGDVYFNTQWNYKVNASILILALELYRNDHGQFPSALKDLVPAYLSAIPDDPYAERGVAFGYETTGASYRLTHRTRSNDKTAFERKTDGETRVK